MFCWPSWGSRKDMCKFHGICRYHTACGLSSISLLYTLLILGGTGCFFVQFTHARHGMVNVSWFTGVGAALVRAVSCRVWEPRGQRMHVSLFVGVYAVGTKSS